MRLLFDTPEAAREVAFMLQCDYDGFTMITVPPIHDMLALRTAIELTGADFCCAGHYPLAKALAADARSQVRIVNLIRPEKGGKEVKSPPALPEAYLC
ncbi:MAG: hypothetical protein KME45_31690 [Stenomitos rutilans HA7619-LM2]|nr:hypothetical protein [Stenomitos rutilans HA7619-LM2]